MAKVIICIHGRSKKPKESTLKKWWKESIKEGLEKSTATTLGNIHIEMVYYADIHYKNDVIQDNDEKDSYKRAEAGSIKTYKEGIVDRIREKTGKWLDSPFDWLEENSKFFSKFATKISKKVMSDLGEYYSDINIKNKVDNRLKNLLIKHRDDEIILISHSMGTIIAYDVLRDIGRDRDYPGFVLSHLITMGSPLGLTPVKGNIINDHNKIRTPSCLRGSWVNFSDSDDYVCLDCHLADDYEANSYAIKVKDVLVCNDYPGNDHKSYGYLRTPEFSKHLASLL